MTPLVHAFKFHNQKHALVPHRAPEHVWATSSSSSTGHHHQRLESVEEILSDIVTHSKTKITFHASWTTQPGDSVDEEGTEVIIGTMEFEVFYGSPIPNPHQSLTKSVFFRGLSGTVAKKEEGVWTSDPGRAVAKAFLINDDTTTALVAWKATGPGQAKVVGVRVTKIRTLDQNGFWSRHWDDDRGSGMTAAWPVILHSAI